MSARRITRVPRADLDKLEDLTDWARVHDMTDGEIAVAAATDPDTVHPDDLRGASSFEKAVLWCRPIFGRGGYRSRSMRM
jgi:hypothetical protein